MIDRDLSVTEDELHAYVDGELPDDRLKAVTAWLAANPEQAALVAHWRMQGDAIRARYGAIAGEPVPDRLQLDRIARHADGNRPSPRVLMAMAATVLLAFGIGTGAGWFARGTETATGGLFAGSDKITADALEAYRLYVVEVRHPVEVPGSERAHLRQWLSKRVGEPLQVPDLQSIGLKLVGGRLLPGPTGAAAFYMYEGPSGERFTIYCAKARGPETALRFKNGARDAAFTWVDDKIGYVVSGPADRERLETVAKNVYEQVDKAVVNKG
jgi:anti-sigma factor RsiW